MDLSIFECILQCKKDDSLIKLIKFYLSIINVYFILKEIKKYYSFIKMANICLAYNYSH